MSKEKTDSTNLKGNSIERGSVDDSDKTVTGISGAVSSGCLMSTWGSADVKLPLSSIVNVSIQLGPVSATMKSV